MSTNNSHKPDNNPILNENLEKEHHNIFTKVGGLFFNVFRRKTENSHFDHDQSYVELSNNEKVQAKLRFSSGGDVLLQSGANITINTPKHLNVSVKGNKQEIVAGNKTNLTRGNLKTLKGPQGKEDKEATEELKKIYKNIQDKRLDAIKNTKGADISCPVCNTTHLINNHSSLVDGLMGFISKMVIPYFCFPIDLLYFILRLVVSPILTPKKNIGLTGEKGCGSPGCKKGMIESMIGPMKAADKAATNGIKSNSVEILKNENKIKNAGSEPEVIQKDKVLKIGLVKNDLTAYVEKGHHIISFSLEPGKNNPDNLALYSKGSCPKIVFCEPQRWDGNYSIDVANKMVISAGSPGVDIETSGRFSARTGDILLNATRGEAVFSSGNLTTIKGKNIILDANDMSGDAGISIQAPNTMINGGLSVRGNAAFKGHVTMDGAVSTPFLIVPSMRTGSTTSSSSKMKVEGANWVASAPALAAANLAKDLIFRYIMSGYIMTIAGLFALMCEVYDVIMQSMTIEPLITGIFFGYAACAVGGGPAFGVVYNFKHNHLMVGADHDHTVTVPKSSFWNTKKAWGGERQGAGPVPSPAPANGDSPSPGPKSKNGSCGGGGLYVKNRNESYNLPPLDPFQGLNYLKVPIQRNKDGSLLRTPQFSVVYGLSAFNNGNVNTVNSEDCIDVET